MKHPKSVSGIWGKNRKAKLILLLLLFSMSKSIGHTEQKSLLHKNEAFYLFLFFLFFFYLFIFFILFIYLFFFFPYIFFFPTLQRTYERICQKP